MIRYNCIAVLDPAMEKGLFCRRIKEPYRGLYNFVGGKAMPEESPEQAASRELFEETGIDEHMISLVRLMEISYPQRGFCLEIFAGRLHREVPLREELNPLVWLSLKEDFTDPARFAGEKNIAHILEIAQKTLRFRKELLLSGRCLGIDGCRGGWVAACIDQGRLTLSRSDSLSSLLDAFPSFDLALIDMPIGLPDEAHRQRPEPLARPLAGKRSSSLFPVPCREAVYAGTPKQSQTANERILHQRLSRQSLALIPKIRELDELLSLRPEFLTRLLESHPELDFARLKGAHLLAGKKSPGGLSERRAILSSFFEAPLPSFKEQALILSCAPDDIADALVLSVSAFYLCRGRKETIPPEPERDALGRRMCLSLPALTL